MEVSQADLDIMLEDYRRAEVSEIGRVGSMVTAIRKSRAGQSRDFLSR